MDLRRSPKTESHSSSSSLKLSRKITQRANFHTTKVINSCVVFVNNPRK